MSITKFPAAVVAAYPVTPFALAQTETGLSDVGFSTRREGAPGYTLLVASTGVKTAAPIRELAASVAVIPKEAPRAMRISAR